MADDHNVHHRSDESSPLLGSGSLNGSNADVESLVAARTTPQPRDGPASPVGERLPYNDYTTIDWLHDLAQDSARARRLGLPHHHQHHHPSSHRGSSRLRLRDRAAAWWDAAQGWVAALVIGVLTAAVAYLVDVWTPGLADAKEGRCVRSGGDGGGGGQWWFWWWWSWLGGLEDRAGCGGGGGGGGDAAASWTPWSRSWGVSYGVYVGIAVAYGLVAGGVTMLTRARLPAVRAGEGDVVEGAAGTETETEDDVVEGVGRRLRSSPAPRDQLISETAAGKVMYMAAGSGIPEIKTILSGFVIPHFLDLRVLVAKAVGATFAVATGMCLGKEGPFVHISTCVGHLVARRFPKYRDNGRKMREMLSVACSAGLSVAFGAPIGGVLFSYEEISTYFPRPVLWKAFLCSLVAAATLKALNPTGTGKLVLFETNYGEDYAAVHYLVFIFLGVCGGVFGGVFCKANFRWAKFFRQRRLIRRSPVLEVSIVVLATALLQYPNRLIRSTGDIVVSELLVSCNGASAARESYVCRQEALAGSSRSAYYAWLATGTLVKLVLMVVTFGCKVPSGIIIPALDAGALFGRMVGQLPFLFDSISPGIFAMVGAAAFLAGVSRMTVSLAVIMFELTGEVNFILPFMIAILTSKWVADAISEAGVYDLSQHLLGHPFLDAEHGLARVRKAGGGQVEALIPPENTMDEITVQLGPDGRVSRKVLQAKLAQLKARGLMDAGLVLVNENGICHGYLPEAELEFGLKLKEEARGEAEDGEHAGAPTVNLLFGPIADFVDRTPITIPSKAPIEFAVEMFGKLGLRYLVVVEEDTARVLGVVIKKRLVKYLDGLSGI